MIENDVKVNSQRTEEKMSFNLFLYTIKPRVVSLFFFISNFSPPLILYGSHVVTHIFYTTMFTHHPSTYDDPFDSFSFSPEHVKCQKYISENRDALIVMKNVLP